VTGILIAKIILVVETPRSGVPEESSKIQPVAAIAAIQHRAKSKPLLGVKAMGYFYE